MDRHRFSLSSGRTLEIEVFERENCIVTSQKFFLADGRVTKQCTVTCSTGKSYSWTCPEDKSCAGDCSDPDNPRGGCE
jgi:hypothetical protein